VSIPVSKSLTQSIHQRTQENRERIVRFLTDICAIPSFDSQLAEVGERVGEEMTRLRFDEVRFDRMGNILGRIGGGPKVIVYDSHIDTVGVGDLSQWGWNPFKGVEKDGALYARGACDEKGSTPGMIYGLAFARDLGLLDGYTAYYFGNMEEACDGIAPNAFVEVDPKVRPDAVVIGEPTRMRVYRGHKGRIEMKITAKGRSAHAASNYLGDNAIYKLIDVIAGIRDLDPKLGWHEFLGKGTITVTDKKVSTASINAVPDEAVIFIDRRLTLGETVDSAAAEVQAVIERAGVDVKLEMLYYDEPSYTGFRFPVEKYYPAWLLEPSHPLVQAGQRTLEAAYGAKHPTGAWSFSTNGTYWAGKAGIPCIGFGPGDETVAHTTHESVPLKEVVDATEFYALLPTFLAD
jgi:putative selenium metabolism hydrolase